jgi:putative SOS response-associated peptidase YedK
MWAALLVKWYAAMASRSIDSFFLMTTENSREMKAVYTRLDNIQSFTEWLEDKAAKEALGFSSGAMFFTTAGVQ